MLFTVVPDRLAEDHGPEEGHSRERLMLPRTHKTHTHTPFSSLPLRSRPSHLVQHVLCGCPALLQRHVPVLYPGVKTGLVVGEGGHIARSKEGRLIP